ncbi:hypothetical protein GpartN1_g5155.t1 [Galdieria partita]|uniref:BZIP domain-containing protein n=1 Tax=Galdieria partita TaxID=83374 RepID=A0A9C7PZE3_9RHOD|nr:hypothetical protein GpartN1_g2099.t1 [Galdieria partita]GJQ13364.1 hypothetical protein GpartN1_g5155.t1 [Galdieria partita]
MGSFEDIFGAWTEDWELASCQFVTESKEPPFIQVPFEDLERPKWGGNYTNAFEGHNSPWWQPNCSNCPFSLSSEENRPDSFEISSSVTHSCSDASPNVPLGTNTEQEDDFEHVFHNGLIEDEPTWDPSWKDHSYHFMMTFTEDTLSEKGVDVTEEQSLHCVSTRRKKQQLETFPTEQLKDLKGSTSAEGRRMTAEERALMLYKRKLRNRHSAARSRRRRTIILNEISEELSTLKTMMKQLQCRLCLYEGGGFLSKVDAKLEEVGTNLSVQSKRLFSIEYQVAILRAKLMGTKVKGTFYTEQQHWENTTERSISFTSV